MAKHIVKMGAGSIVSGATTLTISEPAHSDTTGSPTWSADKSMYNKMNVILDVSALSGTNLQSVTILENFGGVFIETAKTGAISSVGQYMFLQGAAPDPIASVQQRGPYWALGAGTDKKVVIASSTLSSLVVGVYLDFFSER